MKTRQVMKLVDNGRKFSIVYREGSVNPYRLYEHHWCDGRERKRKVIDYANLNSCLWWLISVQEFREG